MDTKTKGHSRLSKLTPEQRRQVDEWLFEGNATYREVVKRCAKKFGITLTISSVARHYQREYGMRIVDRYARRMHEKDALLKVLEGNPDIGSTYRVMIRLAEEMAVEEALKPVKERDFRKVAHLGRMVILARQEANESLRAATVREKFEFDAATACVIHHAKMQEIAEDSGKNDAQKIQEVREMLFGPNLPD